MIETERDGECGLRTPTLGALQATFIRKAICRFACRKTALLFRLLRGRVRLHTPVSSTGRGAPRAAPRAARPVGGPRSRSRHEIGQPVVASSRRI